jgi:hypothetical protein
MQSQMTQRDAEQLVAAVRERILALFPGADDTYELLYARRFQRLIDEFARPNSAGRAVVLPFPMGRG